MHFSLRVTQQTLREEKSHRENRNKRRSQGQQRDNTKNAYVILVKKAVTK